MRSSRTSLRVGSAIDGNGPSVSVGVTAHAVVDVGGVVVVPVVVVVAVEVVAVGLVGEAPLHAPTDNAALAAPNKPSASRRLSRFMFLSDISCCSLSKRA